MHEEGLWAQSSPARPLGLHNAPEAGSGRQNNPDLRFQAAIDCTVACLDGVIVFLLLAVKDRRFSILHFAMLAPPDRRKLVAGWCHRVLALGSFRSIFTLLCNRVYGEKPLLRKPMKYSYSGKSPLRNRCRDNALLRKIARQSKFISVKESLRSNN